MGKKDRAAEIAKQSKKKPDELKNPKTKQQLFQEEHAKRENDKKEKEKAERHAAEVRREELELARVAAQKVSKVPLGGARMGGVKTFAKARQQAQQVQNQNDDSGSESDVSMEEPVPDPVEVEDANKAKKKGKKVKRRISDGWESLQRQATEARNARVVQRIKNMLFVGLLEKKPAVASPTQDSRKKGKKKGSDGEKPKSVVGTVRDFKSLLYSLGILLFLIALKIGEEGYDPYNQRDENELNPYTVLDVSSSATQGDIKKAYKDLALKWHPDKNPDCESCEKHFKEIGKSYELLSNTARRASYDNRRKESHTLETSHSTPLNREDYERKVIRSNDVWIIYVHNSDQGSSHAAYAIYEDLAQKGQHHFKFGHVDAAGEGASVLPLLPVRKGVYPVFLRIARGIAPEIAPLADIDSSKKLTRWAVDSFPHTIPELGDEDAYTELRTKKLDPTKLGRIVFAVAEGADMKKNQLSLLRIAFSLSSFFEFYLIHQDVVPRSIERSAGVMMLYIDAAGEVHRKATDSVKDLEDFESALEGIFRGYAPVVDQTTYSQICGSKHHTRKYCLALIDPTAEQIAQVLDQLNAAKAAHETEQKELEGSQDYIRIDAPNIQLISILRSPSMFASEYPVSRSFNAWHRQEGIVGASQFLLEEATDRARNVDDYRNVLDWYQMLALDDLTLREVGSMKPHLADPFMSIREDLRQVFLGSFLRIILFFLFAVVVAAVLPELDKQQVLALLAIVPPVVIVITSYVLRKSIVMAFRLK